MRAQAQPVAIRSAVPSLPAAPRRVLMFAFYFPPENASGAHRPFRFARYLRPLGYEVHVITAAANSHSGPWEFTYDASNNAPVPTLRYLCHHLARGIQRVLPYNDQVPWIPHAFAKARNVIEGTSFDAVISTSPPIACHLAAFAVKQVYGLRWIADFRDPIVGNPFRQRAWGAPWDRSVERLIMSSADSVIANTSSALNTLADRYPAFSDKVHLIWNGYDPEMELTASATPSHARKVIVHAGSLYGPRHPSTLIDSLERLIATGTIRASDICLRLVGDIERDSPWVTRPSFQSLVSRGSLDCTYESVPRSAAIREMTEASYLLLLDINGADTSLQVPGKLFEYIQIGRPIVAVTNPNSPVETILGRSGIPHVCIYPNQPPEETDARVRMLLAMDTHAVQPSAWFLKEFNGRTQAERLAALLDTVPKPKRMQV